MFLAALASGGLIFFAPNQWEKTFTFAAQIASVLFALFSAWGVHKHFLVEYFGTIGERRTRNALRTFGLLRTDEDVRFVFNSVDFGVEFILDRNLAQIPQRREGQLF
jgi:hypothetical protein